LFHQAGEEMGQTVEGNRALKERLVNDGQAHAALVFDGEAAVAWCGALGLIAQKSSREEKKNVTRERVKI